ncbi:origin recognition complex subunit 2-domain-containing protein [Jimgerdemannia flammicorona]|uniref:Origin recognition complex subunit 2 n=1 Tax=Jimgerdemannia flammicorona TaxID=994334 RepID=A0A433D1C2_9FUNG|nr:origin recognition complex subunit 2-domain-containing protein [Jimgerdemannia flammicorona]
MIPISYQADDEIPHHIRNTLSPVAAKKESALANALGPVRTLQGQKKSPRKPIVDTGLTVETPRKSRIGKDPAESSNPFVGENEEEFELAQQRTPSARMRLGQRHGVGEDDDDKENQQATPTSGRKLFGFTPRSQRKKGFESLLKKVAGTGKEEEEKEEEGGSEMIEEVAGPLLPVEWPPKTPSKSTARKAGKFSASVDQLETPTRKGKTPRSASVKRLLFEAEESEEEGDENMEPPGTPSRTPRTARTLVILNNGDPDRSAKRRRIARKISRMNEVASESEGGDDDELEAAADDEEEPAAESEASGDEADANAIASSSSHRPLTSFFEDDATGYDRYFQDLHGTSKTSNNTLSKLPILDRQDLADMLQAAPRKHAREIGTLARLHEHQFSQWCFELASGFNLLFYGYGSKRNLLTRFATSNLTDAPLLVVNGYFPSITIKDILTQITSGALNHTGSMGSIQEHTAFVHAYFSQPDDRRRVNKLYLLVHNIDGPALRNDRVQTALSVLASAPNIHVVASMDHINAALLWDGVRTARFNWAWHDATTYDDYLVETSFEDSIMVRRGVMGAQGVNYVLASLTSNARGIFRILAEHQILETTVAGENAPTEEIGLLYGAYFARAREGFYVSNDITFRTQLTEFRDHKIIQSKRVADGSEVLYIPLDAETLTGILESMV